MSAAVFFSASLIFVFLVTVIITKNIIPVLKRMKMGQTILEIGPKWHKSKEGTPTMGGVSFLIAIPVAVFILAAVAYGSNNISSVLPLIFTVIFAVLNALIGITDDMTKIRRKQNAGLSPMQKIILQTAVAAIYLTAMRLSGNIDTLLYIPYFSVEVELGAFYYVFALILILGVVNCANLTDGIDGLAASVAFAIGVFFGGAAILYDNISLIIISGALCGGTLGFLVYNFHPAKIFMGDTGSLFLGAVAVGCAFIINNPLIILICGIIYVIEGASVILQVAVYKLTHRRLFRMAPIHHHFEKCGISEVGVVLMFTLITLVFSALAIPALR